MICSDNNFDLFLEMFQTRFTKKNLRMTLLQFWNLLTKKSFECLFLLFWNLDNTHTIRAEDRAAHSGMVSRDRNRQDRLTTNSFSQGTNIPCSTSGSDKRARSNEYLWTNENCFDSKTSVFFIAACQCKTCILMFKTCLFRGTSLIMRKQLNNEMLMHSLFMQHTI